MMRPGLFGDPAFCDCIFYHSFRIVPQDRRPILHGAVSQVNLLFPDPVLSPHDPAGPEIVQKRLKPVQSGGEQGILRLSGFEFFPERAELASLVFRQKTENPVRRPVFPLGLPLLPSSS